MQTEIQFVHGLAASGKQTQSLSFGAHGSGGPHLDFMRTIAASDVVYMFLSDTYLRSPYCMYELLLIWHGSLDDPDKFIAGAIRDLK
jgi:hypothetical protein